MLFLLTFLVSFFRFSRARTDLHNKLIILLCAWLIFSARSAIKLNYFRISCKKMIYMCMYFKTETDVAQNLIDYLSSTLTVRRPFHRKDFKWKKNMGVRGYFLKKGKLCMQNLAKEWKQPSIVILQWSIFTIFIRCFWLRIIRRSDQSV